MARNAETWFRFNDLLNIKIYDLSLQQNEKICSVTDAVSVRKSKQNVRYFQNIQQSMLVFVLQRKKIITSQVTLKYFKKLIIVIWQKF